MDMEPMLIVKRKHCEHDCLSINFTVVDFYVVFVKEKNYNMIMISTYSGIIVCECQKEECLISKVKV